MEEECREHSKGCRCREDMFDRAVQLLFESVRRRKDMELTQFHTAVHDLLGQVEEWEEEYGANEEP